MYKYRVHIIARDINFDPTYKNVVQFFNATLKTKDYTGVFTNDELTFAESEETINFDPKDAINANICVDYNDDFVLSKFGVASMSINDALNRQYCIIKESKYNDETEAEISSKLYFYFITNATIKNDSLVNYTLKLDVFTTYPLYSDIDIDKTKILRAHIKRFTGASYSNVNFDLTNKYLTTGEPIDNEFSKIKIEDIEPNFKKIGSATITKITGSDTLPSENDTIENVLNSLTWLYIIRRKKEGGGSYVTNYLFFAPFLNNKIDNFSNILFYVSPDNDPNNFIQIDANALYAELLEDPYIYNAYISPLAPYGTMATGNFIYYNYNDNTKVLEIIFNKNNVYNYQNLDKSKTDAKTFSYDSSIASAGVYIGYDDNIKAFISYFETDDITLFDKSGVTLSNTPFSYSEIAKAEIKTKIRPSYNEYNLKCELDTSTTTIDLSILQTNYLTLKAINNLSNNTNGEIYFTCNDIYKKDYGIFTQAQYTPLMFSDKFKEYKATNRNYQITGQAIPMITGTLGGAVSGGLKFGAVGAVVGGVVGFGTSAIKVHTNFDNMKNSPNSIKLKGQNISIDNKVKQRFFNIEHNRLRDEDLNAVNLYFYEYGYTINNIDEIKNYLTRSSFNYIQLEDPTKDIHALLNENVLQIVIDALKNGVRFWTKAHYINDRFNYTTNNLETL